jgi:ribosomal protein S18 acetylase RimI-like enzyme
MSEVIIRRFDPADRRSLEQLVTEMQDFERGLDARLLPGAEMAAAYTAELLRLAAEDEGGIWVADHEAALVGFIALRSAVPSEELDQPPGSYALVSDLAVTASHRGRGIGRALLRTAETHARDRGATELRIAVLSENAPARGLYLEVGFAPYLEIFTKRL